MVGTQLTEKEAAAEAGERGVNLSKGTGGASKREGGREHTNWMIMMHK